MNKSTREIFIIISRYDTSHRVSGQWNKPCSTSFTITEKNMRIVETFLTDKVVYRHTHQNILIYLYFFFEFFLM